MKHFCISSLTVILFSFLMTACQTPEVPKKEKFYFIEGFTQGTTFHIKYATAGDSLHTDEIFAQLAEIDRTFSLYNPNSLLVALNENKTDTLNPAMEELLNCAFSVFEETGGYFDMTVGVLVKAWGFGPDNQFDTSKIPVDSLLLSVGMEKVKVENHRLVKTDSAICLDANAIAQGYSVDVIAQFLESRGIENYMVEIGGEVRVNGINDKGLPWKVGIDRPVEGSSEADRVLESIVAMNKGSLATSGSYRKFIIENGVKYSHTINPKTGYPAKHKLLSVTIVAEDCATADALATAVMAMGPDSGQAFVLSRKGTEAFFIISDDKGAYTTWMTDGMKKMIYSPE